MKTSELPRQEKLIAFGKIEDCLPKLRNLEARLRLGWVQQQDIDTLVELSAKAIQLSILMRKDLKK